MSRRAALLSIPAAILICGAPFVGPELSDDVGQFVFWNLRVPRVLVAALVGATLSTVGAVYQTLFANPLATPGTVGTTAGATMAALVAMVFGAGTHVLGLPIVMAAAFVGALGVSAVVTFIAVRGDVGTNEIVLAGVACSVAASAIALGVQFSADSEALLAAARWSLGNLQQIGYVGASWLAVVTVTSSVPLLRVGRSLDAMAGGLEVAHAQGVSVRRVRSLCVAFGSLGVGACVASCGPIAFVELIVPNLLRALGCVRPTLLLPLSALVGAAFLVTCDTAARTLLSGREIPVGVVTAALGAPAMVALLWRRRGNRGE